MNVVEIKWIDSVRDATDWSFPEEIEEKDSLISSVGYLWKEDENSIIIIQSFGHGDILFRLKIPKCSILQTKILTNENLKAN